MVNSAGVVNGVQCAPGVGTAGGAGNAPAAPLSVGVWKMDAHKARLCCTITCECADVFLLYCEKLGLVPHKLLAELVSEWVLDTFLADVEGTLEAGELEKRCLL